MGQSGQAENIGLEHAAHGVEVGLFDGAVLAIARIVDQGPDAAVRLRHGRHRGPHRLLVGHIQSYGARPRRGQLGEALLASGGRVNRVAGLDQQVGTRATDAGRAAGDQDGIARLRHLVSLMRGADSGP